MRNTLFSLVGGQPGAITRPERGAAVVVLLFALSIFSVLALTVLRNSSLEAVLRTSDHPDLHVVLYTGGAGSPQVVGRLNLPTIWRLQESVPDTSAEVRAPGPVGTRLASEMEPGWAYAVQLATTVRVCCDSGDGACANVTWDQQVAEGSASPAIDQALEPTDTARRLQFALFSADIADNVSLDPNAAVESPFIVRATRVPEGIEMPHTGGATVSCRLDTKEKTLATGTLQLNPGGDAQGRVNRVSAGSIVLNYYEPVKR
jgi:hypothetical protein